MKFETMIVLASCLIVTLFLLTGCTSTAVEYGKFRAKRVSFLQSISIKVCLSNDILSVEYANDGGGTTAGAMAGSTISQMVK